MTFLRVPISVYLDPKILSANEVSQHFFRMVRDVSASVSREKKLHCNDEIGKYGSH